MSQQSPTGTYNETDTSIRVVGIVASVGSPTAATQVLAHLAADFPVPILWIWHLSGERDL
jgi:chemotaxis response regulator CheB